MPEAHPVAPESCINERRRLNAYKFGAPRMAVDAQRMTHGVGARWHAVRRRYKWWQLALFVIGLIAFVSVMSALFFAVGDKPSRVYTDSTAPEVSSADFATALSAIVGAPVEAGGTVTVLNNGDEFVPALLESVNQATQTINFMRVHLVGRHDQRPASGRARTQTARRRPGAHPARRPGQPESTGRRFRGAQSRGREGAEVPHAEVWQAHTFPPPQPSAIDRHRRGGGLHRRYGRVGCVARTCAGSRALARHDVQSDRADGAEACRRPSSICG